MQPEHSGVLPTGSAKKAPKGRAGRGEGGESISELTQDEDYAKEPLSILSRFPTHSELSLKSEPGWQYRLGEEIASPSNVRQ